LYPAHQAIYEAHSEIMNLPKMEAYEVESICFGKLSQTDESKALRHLYHSQQLCKKNLWRMEEAKANTAIKELSVVGSGFMGSGIANVSLGKNISVNLIDSSSDSLLKARKSMDRHFRRKEKSKGITRVDYDRIKSTNLEFSAEIKKCADSDIVIEAIPEVMAVKKQFFSQLQDIVTDRCIIASNTSALPISKLGADVRNPERFIGIHYFSPVERMKLVEIIRSDRTSDETVSKCFDFVIKQNKIPIVVNDCPGFYTTRVLMAIMSESIQLLQEGAGFFQIDECVMNLGFPVGFIKLVDEVGIDVAAHIYHSLSEHYGEKMNNSNAGKILDELVSAGCLGKKTGRGLYSSPASFDKYLKKMAFPAIGTKENPTAMKIVQNNEIQPKLHITDELIKQRVMIRFINEALLCLEEKIITRPQDGDIGAVFGIGFPPCLGGPFKMLDLKGSKEYYDKANEFHKVYGPTFKPCKLFEQHAAGLIKFY